MREINYSIIIPHYNVPKLLLRCLNSIPCRDDIEIIVVDDCSEDFDIYKDIIKKDFYKYNISIYSTSNNSGPGAGRNIGLDNANGKWIIFIDSDDYFSSEIEMIFDNCKNKKEEILFFHNTSVMNDDITVSSTDYVYEDLLYRYEKTGNEEELRYKHYSVCSKIFKHSFIDKNNLRFNNQFYGEDLLFSIKAGYLCNSISVLPYHLEIITTREKSLSRSWKNWGEWYKQFFPAHIEGMHYLHKHKIHAIDQIVYEKIYFIMENDYEVFKEMLSLLNIKEKIAFFIFLVTKTIKKYITKIRKTIK